MSANAKITWEADFEAIRVVIGASYLAQGLSPEGVEALARLGRRRAYEAGEEILHQDDTDSNLLILGSGRAEISTYASEPLYYLTPGMPFGEVALLDEKPRSATVTAMVPSEVVSLPAEHLRHFIDANPSLGLVIVRNLAKVLCARVRAGNQQIAVLLTIEELRDGKV